MHSRPELAVFNFHFGNFGPERCHPLLLLRGQEGKLILRHFAGQHTHFELGNIRIPRLVENGSILLIRQRMPMKFSSNKSITKLTLCELQSYSVNFQYRSVQRAHAALPFGAAERHACQGSWGNELMEYNRPIGAT